MLIQYQKNVGVIPLKMKTALHAWPRANRAAVSAWPYVQVLLFLASAALFSPSEALVAAATAASQPKAAVKVSVCVSISVGKACRQGTVNVVGLHLCSWGLPGAICGGSVLHISH